MAKGAVGNYLKNVSSSIKYAAIDKFKELTPATADFVENNATMFREVRDSVTKMRSSNMKQISNQIDRRSKIFDTADKALKNVFSDLRSGKFYNKEREISGDMFGDDMGFEDQDSWVNSDWNLDDDSQYLGGMMDQVGAKTTSAICNTMAQTSTAINENIKASTKLSYTQNIQTYNLLRKGLTNISDNIAQMVEFSNTVVRTHAENSKSFYEASTNLQQKQVELLEKIYDSVREDKKPNTRRERGLSYSTVTSGGIVDFKEYAKLIKKNMSNTVSGSPLGMLQGMDPNMLMGMITSSPLQFIPKAMMDKMVSKNAEKIFEDFNNTFSGLFGSIMMKVNEYSESGDNAFLKSIANTLGIKSSLKTSLSTSNYEKGNIRWNGKANKALTEVIPTYLAKIEAALTGKTARVFDYEAGAFVNADKIRENLNDKFDSRAKSAGYDMISRFKSESNYIQFNTTKEQEQFNKDIDNFFIALFKRGKSFDFTKKNIDNEFRSYGVSSKQNFQIIKNMFMTSPKGMQMMLNDRILKERDSYNNIMMDLESQGNDLSLMLYNNSGLLGEDEEVSRARADIVKLENYQKTLKYKSTEKYKKVSEEIDKLKEKVRNSSSYKEDTKPTNNNFLVKYVDKKGHNVFWYLENILVAIRNGDGFGGGNYVVPDDSITTSMEQYEERRRDAADVSLRQRNADARSKDLFKYMSAEEAADFSKMQTNARIRKEAELKAEKDRRKWEGYLFDEGEIDIKEFRQKMSEADLFGKFKLLSSAMTNIVQRPMNAMAKIADGIDKKMYNLMYGGPIVMEDGTKVEGLLGLMSYHVKDTFSNIKEWFNDSFGAFFNTRFSSIAGKVNFKKFFDETAFGRMAKEFGDTIVGAFKTAKLGVTSVVNPLTEKIVGKKVGSIDEIVINGVPLRSYFDPKMSDKEILERVKSDPRFLNISSSDKKMIDRYSGNFNRYNSAISKTFGNLTSKMKLSASDNETLQRLLAPMFYNLSLDQMGKNEKEVIRNLKSGKFGTLEDLFGKLIKDENGNWIHDKTDPNRLITDDALYASFMEAMDKSGFAKARGHESYNIGTFFDQDFSTGLHNVEDALNQIYEEANQYNKKVTDQNGTLINQQSSIVSNVERIVYYLSKIAGEETPGYIKAKMFREKTRNEEIGRENHEFLAKFRGFDSPYSSSYNRREKSGSTFGDAWDNLDLTQLGKGIGRHANGARYITKSGITAISKGEMVIPSDKNPFNPNRNKVNRNQEIINEKRIIREFSKGKTPYMNYTGTVDDLTQQDIDLIAGQFDIPDFNSKYMNLSRLDNGETASRSYTATDTDTGRRVLFIVNADKTTDIQNYHTTGVERAAEILGDNLNTAVESLTGITNDQKKSGKLREAIEDMISKSGKYGPRMLAGGLVGAFSSGALTANVIHPMVGAVIGAGTALLSSSDKFREWMFGINEDGEFKGGIIPPKIVNWLAKNGRTIGLTGLGGAVIGSLKSHPLIGLALGAGVGLVGSSDKFKEFMFGESGLINPDRKAKISKFIKSTIAGTLGTSIIAPKLMGLVGSTGLGILPQLLLGAGVGMISSSEKFQEMIFGKKNEATGEYEHGLLPLIKSVTVDPLKRMMHGIEERATAFLKVSVKEPLMRFFEPLHRMRTKSNEMIKEFFGNISDKIGRDLSGGFKKVFQPIFKAIGDSNVFKTIKNVFGTSLKVLGTVVNPFKWLETGGKLAGNIMGKMGLMNHLTTEEYNNRYGFFGKAAMRRKGQDTFDVLDEKNLTPETYKMLIETFDNAKANKKTAIKNEKEAAKRLSATLMTHFGNDFGGFDRAKAFAESVDTSFFTDPVSDKTRDQFEDLMLDAYRQNIVGKSTKSIQKDVKSSEKLLWDILAKYNNADKATRGISLIRNAKNATEALAILTKAGIVIPEGKKEKFGKEFDRYKGLSSKASATKNLEAWDSLGGNISASERRKLQIEQMKSDESFHYDDLTRRLHTEMGDYRSAHVAATGAESILQNVEVQNALNKMGINPEHVKLNQLTEILRTKYKNLNPEDFEETVEEENAENTTSIVDSTSKMVEQNDDIIKVLGEIRDRLDPTSEYSQNVRNIDQRARQLAAEGKSQDEIKQNLFEEFGEDSDRYIQAAVYSLSRNASKNVIPTRTESILETTSSIFKDSEEDTTGTLYGNAYKTPWERLNIKAGKINDYLNTDAGVLWDKFRNRNSYSEIYTDNIENFAKGSKPLHQSTLAAISAGELILDAGSGYSNGLSSNRIWNLADGAPVQPIFRDPDRVPSKLESMDRIFHETEPKTEDPKKMSLFQKMSFNMEKMRQAFTPDRELKDTKGGKGPSFLQKMGMGLKNIFDPKKLFKKTGMLVVGAGLLLAPLADKILGAVVPFLTEKVIPAITEALPGVLDSIMDLIPSIMEMITTTLPKFVKSIATDLLPALLELLPGLIAGTGDAIAGLVGALPKIIKPIMDMLPVAISTILKDVLPTLLDMLPELIETLLGSLGDITQSLLEGLVSVLGSIIKNLPMILVNLLKGIGDVGVGLIKGLFSWGSGKKKKPKVQTAINEKMELPSSFIENMAAAGKGKQKKNIFTMAGSGITSFFKNLFKRNKNTTSESTEDSTSNIETYSNGMSYLNGKQINPVLAHISQNAQKYKNRPFNLPNIDKGITLGTDGCGVMSGAMVINGLLGDNAITPEKVAEAALHSGNKAAGGGVKTKFFKEYFKKFGIDTVYHNMSNNSDKAKSKKNIIDALKANKPVILMGNDLSKSGKTPFPDNNHYVVATGISDDGSKIILNDPYNSVGGDVYNLDDVLDKTIVGIEASKNKTGLTLDSIKYTKKAESSNTYSGNRNISVTPISTNTPTTNLGKAFDPIAYQDLGNYNPMTVEEMDNFINYWASINGHTEFVGHGDVFIKAAEETGLDPRYILAHAATESNWGTSRIAKEKGNYFGITAYNDSPYASATKFNSGMQGIIDGAKWIRKNYYDAGQRSLYDMIYGNPSHRYAVYDNGSPNSGWVSTIASIMRKGPNAYTNTANAAGGAGLAMAIYPGTTTLNPAMKISQDIIADNAKKEIEKYEAYDDRTQILHDPTLSANDIYTEGIGDADGFYRDELNTMLNSSIYLGRANGNTNYSNDMAFAGYDYKTSNDLVSKIYTSFYNEGLYSDIKHSGSTINDNLRLRDNTDKMYEVLKYLYGKKFTYNYNTSHHGDFANSHDFLNYKSIAKSVYSELYKNVHNMDDSSKSNHTADESGYVAFNSIDDRINAFVKQSSSTEGSKFVPLVWDTLDLNQLTLTNDQGKQIKFKDEFSNIPGADILLREILYNPAIINSDKLSEIQNKLKSEYYTDQAEQSEYLNKLNKLVRYIHHGGIKLDPGQTELLYKSPALYRAGNILQFGTYGSPETMGTISPMSTFPNWIRYDKNTYNKLVANDIEMMKLSDKLMETEEGSEITNLQKYLELSNLGAVSKILTDAEKNNNDMTYEAAKDAEETLKQVEAHILGDEITEESTETTGEKFSIIDAFRNIGSFFSTIFDRIADLIWGNGAFNTGVIQHYGNPNASSVDERYNYQITKEYRVTLVTKNRPDKYADNNTKKNSTIIKPYLTMTVPNRSYTDKHGLRSKAWSIDVYAKSASVYFLYDGYYITVPQADILNYEEIKDKLQSAKRVTPKPLYNDITERESTELHLKNRPDIYGDATDSDVLKLIKSRNIPDHIGTGVAGDQSYWKLKVYGRDGNGNYLLSDGKTVNIPDKDILNSALIKNISTFGLTQNGQNINDLIGDTNLASDNFFLNSFKSQGSTLSAKSSTGPALDTINTVRLHSGIDYATGKTNPAIYSPISGIVERVSGNTGAAGNYLAIRDDGSVDGTPRYHRFMHMLNKPNFKVGDKINQGDLLGYVGNTGSSSGEHLHYDISDETGLAGASSMTTEEQVNAHYKDPNAYLGTYFKNQGYKGNAIHSQNNSSSSSEAKGGEFIGSDKIYELMLKVIEYLSTITTNTGLIGEIVTLLTQLDEINSNTSLTPAQKTEATIKVRKSLADKAQQYSRTLNSANNEMTGHQSMVKSMQVIAAN